ncbi:MAG: ATP-binding protein [Spirochaetia bacterium]
MKKVTQFVTAHGDFINFVSLFAFMLCTLECTVLNREVGREHRWLSYFSFYLFESLALLLLLIAPVAKLGSEIALLTSFMHTLAFSSLFAFGSIATASPRNRWVMVALTLVLLAGCGVVGLIRGAAVFRTLVLLVLGVPGIVLTVRFFLSDPAVRNPGRPWLVSHVAALVAYWLVALLQAGDVLFLGGASANGLLIARVVASIALGVSLPLHEWRSFGRLNQGYGRPITRAVGNGAFLLLPVIMVGAWFMVEALGGSDQRELSAEYLTQEELIRTSITSQTMKVAQASQLLSSYPPIVAFMAQRGGSSKAFADKRLDEYSKLWGTTCYLLDHEGMAVASSNRNQPISFVGHRFADMPDSVHDLAEQQTGFFAFGSLSGYAGYYAISPVRTESGNVLGFAIIKEDFESLFHATAPIPDVFLVDPNGIIFLSTAPEYSYHALWPVSETRQRFIISSGQFGSLSFNPVLTAEPLDGSIVAWRGSRVMVTRLSLNIPGWSIIHFGSMDEIGLYRLGGLLLALVVTFLVALYSAMGRISLLDQVRIERSEAHYRTLVEGSPNWISTVDAKGVFLFTNRAGWESLGIFDAGPTEQRIESILGPENVARIASQVEIALQGNPIVFESIMPSVSGDPRAWRITLVPLGTADQEPTAILIGNDVTDMRRAEARLVRAERIAALGTLTGGIAHQFNNINAVALGYIQVLEMQPNLPEKTKSYLRLVRETVERSVDITSRLLPLSVSQTVEDTPLLLANEVRAAITGLQGDFGREGVDIECNLEEGLTVTINREQLVFMLNALLVNAWHAVLGQPVRRVRVITGKKDAEVFLRVEDTGIGVAKDKLSSLFTPFFSLKGEHAQPQSPQARVRGVGLSLAVMHSIVTGKAGRIDVESAPGIGSTFTVWLPQNDGGMHG